MGPHVTPSLWGSTVNLQRFPSFKAAGSDMRRFDVVVVGGGITGLTCAWLLKKAGKKVAVLEAKTIGSGTTGQTTAHITAAYDHDYMTLEGAYGVDVAKDVCSSLLTAIDDLETIIRETGINCDFMRVPGYYYSESMQDKEELTEKCAGAQRAGLPVRMTDTVPLPFSVAVAYEVANQAQFHPLKYLQGLAMAVDGEGSAVFENTRVFDFADGEPCVVETNHGKLSGEQVVLATHNPLGFSFIQSELPPYRSFVVAFKTPTPLTQALFWDNADPYHYIRSYVSDSGSYMIVGGCDFKTAHGEDADSYRQLETYVREKFSDVPIEYRWSGQYYDPTDHLPFIGLRPGHANVYVASGFSGDGMSFGMVAARLIADEIFGLKSPYEDLYSPTRMHLQNLGTFIKENADVAKCFVGDRISAMNNDASEPLQPGEGRIIHRGLSSVAAYRTEQGGVRYFSAVCPHMKCLVRWNHTERSFDCPCHGSRFDTRGQVLEGPSLSPLKALDPTVEIPIPVPNNDVQAAPL